MPGLLNKEVIIISNINLKNYILNGKYDEAKEICDSMSMEDIKNEIIQIAYQTESLSVYAFSEYMSSFKDCIEWNKLIIEILINPLCFIEGAYSIAFHYSKQLLKKEYSIDNMERLLFFYDIPERLLEKEKALDIAKSIIQIDSMNAIAKKVLKEHT